MSEILNSLEKVSEEKMSRTKSAVKPSFELQKAGQSPWLDSISRELLSSGTLKRYIQKLGLLGVTSNPAIFEKAINGGKGYERDIKASFNKGKSVLETYDALSVSDIQKACDLFKSVYKKSGGEHGYVSLEVLPNLAYNIDETLSEAKRLFKLVNRPNVMIKVPATCEGIVAIEELIANGININVTLIFSRKHYTDVAKAYIRGLEKLSRKSPKKLARVHSVASVFVSRIDTAVDGQLDEILKSKPDSEKRIVVKNLLGKAALSNSKLVYQDFKKIFTGAKWNRLEKKGANIQKVLWGSTGVKNPAYSDLLYVEPLVGRHTVNTLPEATWNAVCDHGDINADTVEHGVREAEAVVQRLKTFGIDVNAICQKLQDDGVVLFVKAFEQLMKALEDKRDSVIKGSKLASFKFTLPAAIEKSYRKQLVQSKKDKLISRWLEKDTTLWTRDAKHKKVILNRLGWVNIANEVGGKIYEIDMLRESLLKRGIKDVVLLGMGGSSLAAEVLSTILNKSQNREKGAAGIKFHLLDTTDPAAILNVQKKISLKKSVFIVASKSGGTIETLSQFRYFFSEVKKAYKNEKKAGEHFVAVTDSGSGLEAMAREKNFVACFINPSDIGGRYSALSLFGLVTAGLCGLKGRDFLADAKNAWGVMRNEKDIEKQPGMAIGLLMGILAEQDINKMTFWTTKSLRIFADWAEQLIAESTGKDGKGIVPVAGEKPLPIESYGRDRYFVVLKQKGEKDAKLDASVKAVKKAGFPVIEVTWNDANNVGGEFLNWEIATAISSHVLGVNPFDELNVTESKEITGKLLGQVKKKKKLSLPKDLVKFGNAKVTEKENSTIQDFFDEVEYGDYVAFLAYFERSPESIKAMEKIQFALAKKLGVPVLVGFGPRYLHSIGQLYKGGPRTGKFIELFVDDAKDMAVPSAGYKFSQLKNAQALGDYKAITTKDLPVLPVNLGKNPLKVLPELQKVFLKS